MMTEKKQDLFGILLVDDEPYVREGLKRLIDWSSYGFTIIGEAAEGATALRLIRELKPHVVITDIRMPEADGLELIRRAVVELRSDSKFIILSGYEDFRYAQTAMRYHVKKYILKPIEEDELTEALNELNTEIVDRIKEERERAESLSAMAAITIRKLLKGDVNADAAAFTARCLNVRDGQDMMIVAIEVLNARQWLTDMDYEEIQANISMIHKCIADTLGKDGALNIMADEPSRFILLLTSALLTGRQMNGDAFCRALYGTILSRGDYQIAIYMGKTVQSLARLKDSHDVCMAARERDFFERKRGVVPYEPENMQSLNYGIKQEITNKELLNAIESNRKERIQEAGNVFFAELQRQNLAPEVVWTCITGILLEVSKSIAEKNGDCDKFLSQLRLKDLEQMTATELKTRLMDFCMRSADYIKCLKENNTPAIMTDVERYIRKNYRRDISLKSVAEQFYINPVYLGQLFKKKYGTYFNDFLHSLRIDEASNLLIDTDLRVHEIANRVGYTDPDYFVRKFKILLGTSPSQYRSEKSI